MASNHQREELHKAIWSIADDLRGSVDGWDFKQYVLGVMFYRYISENIANYINEGERRAGDATFDYANLEDSEAELERDNLVTEKGFFIRPSELFCNVIKSAKSHSATFTDNEGKTKNIKDNLNEYLEMIFNNIENSAKGTQSEDDFSGLFDDIDVNSNKLGATVAKRNEKLLKILDGIAGINLGNYKDNDIDAFGDAYEFLMSMYASNAGKSGGEFYTPQEVSELLTKLAILDKKINDDVFEMELVRQLEVNIDYILMLVTKYHKSNCKDQEIRNSIDKAIRASLSLRSKKDLIDLKIVLSFMD
ncbi:type I restriction-modification system subunit M [Campylobacter hyointestinalis]|uniref:type I restriction-modification system subunit M n=1 Tax=Campylobacter hyointestinalis TaxID=198 RepID=UPI000DCCA5AC|nr:type I restriction-modification system subunit M [Campylobacter hyointestinalis]RAZ51609.1 type I restriction-modification system subunit M [Campylobacter hyointestinalis subsp. lawsonii]